VIKNGAEMRCLLCRNGCRALNRRRDALDVRDEWASRVTLRPFAPAAAPAESMALMTTPRTANPARSMLAASG
jgi:hypothetical protein